MAKNSRSRDSIRIAELTSFRAVQKHGGQNRASRHVDLSQTTVGRHMKRLRMYFGAPLFTPDWSELTVQGEIAWRAAQRVLETLEHARDQIASQPLRIGFIRMVRPLVERALRQEKRRTPELNVRLVELSSERQVSALDDDRLDIAICYALPQLERRGDLVHSLVCEQPFALVVPSHAHRRGELVPAALAPLDYVHPPRWLARHAVDAGERWLADRGLAPARKLQHELGSEVIAYAAAGCGYGFLPALWSSVAHDGAAFVPVPGFAPKAKVAAYSRLDGHASAKRLRKSLADAARAALRDFR